MIQALSSSKKICYAFKSIPFRKKLAAGGFVGALIIFSIIYKLVKVDDGFIGFLLDLSTLSIVILVSLYEVVKDWELSLNKYLSVQFIDPADKKKIECLYAPLLGEADTRAMAQSIGQSINFGERLPISPMLKTIKTSIVEDDQSSINQGKAFVSYEVTIRLTQPLTTLGKHAELTLAENEYLLWEPPFDAITQANIKPI
jgi:hypothetical protein